MSPLPFTRVNTVEAPPVTSAPLDSTRLFVVAEGFRGGPDPIRIASPRELSQKLERTGVGIPGYDAVDVALREGVPEVVFQRIVGDAPVAASINLLGPGGQPALKFTANEVGEWGNGATGGLKGEVTSPGGGSNRQIVITRNGVTVASSPVFTARADALAWNLRQSLGTLSLGTENALPSVAAVANLTGGTADSGTIDGPNVVAALGKLRLDLGTGQVVTPGRATLETNTALLTHCDVFDRTALLEATDGLVVNDILTLSLALRGLGSGAEGTPRLGGLWAQNAIVPGLAAGSSRSVPWTVVVAGLIARLQKQAGHPNVAPFGDFGVPQYATGVSRYFTSAEAETLFAGGVNIVERLFDAPRNATFRTLEDELSSEWVELAHTRTDRAIHAEARDVGRNMGARVVNRQTVQEFGSRLRVRLAALWTAGALFGDTSDEASRVDVDSSNSVTTMAAREVNADVGFRASPHAEFVNINVAKIPITQNV